MSKPVVANAGAGLITADQLRLYFGQIEERTDIWISPALCRRLLQEILGKRSNK